MKKFLGIFLALLMLVSIPLSVKAEDNGEGVLNIGAVSPFTQSREAQSLVFDMLGRLNEDNGPKAQIITDWEHNDDYTKYTFTFRTDVGFHDGSRISAEDVRYSIEAYGALTYMSYAYALDKVEVKDDSHVTVSFSAPYVHMAEDLARIPLVRENTWDESGSLTNFNGSGPFVYKDTDAGEVAELERFKDYWNKDYVTDVERIYWHHIPDDQSRKLALQSGQVDVLGLSEHYISMPFSVIDELKGDPNLTIEHEPMENYTSVGAVMLNWKKGLMTSLPLRKAVSCLIDRDELVSKLYFDVPKACGHIYNPELPDGPKNEKPFAYDLEAAQKWLAEAGYTMGSADTPTVNKEGEPLVLKFITDNEEYQKDLSLYLQERFKQYGIQLDIENLDYTASSEKLKAGDYDLHMGHPWFSPLIDCLGFMGLSDEYTDYGLGFCMNDEMRRLGEEYYTVTSPEDARRVSDAIWKVQYDEAIVVPLFVDIRYLIFDHKFEGFHFDKNVFQIDLNGVLLSGK